LRVHRQGDHSRAIFRCIQNGVNYIDYIFVRGPDGKPRIGDLYDYGPGELKSAAYREAFASEAAHAGPAAARLSMDDREFAVFEGQIQKIRELMLAGKFKEALDIHQRLPDVVKKHPSVLHLHLAASCGLDAECDETIRAYRAACPDDPGVDLVLLGYYARHKKLDEMLACIDRLDKAVGGDPYLDTNRSIVYGARGDLAAAKKCAENAIAAEPDEPWPKHCLELVTQAEKGGPVKRPAAAAKPIETPRGEPAGDEEAKTFAETFAKSIARSDKQAIRAAIDAAAIFKRTMDGAGIPEEARGGIESQFATILDPAIADFFGFGVPVVEKGSQFQLLHLRRANGEQHAIFRLVHANGSLTYYDCTLVRNANGKVLIDDVYSFEAGTSLADAVCRIVQFAMEKLVPSPQSSGADGGNGTARLAVALTEMQQRCKEGQFQAALDIYEKLPENLQKEKAAMLTRIQAASRVKGKPYDDAIRAYRKEYPNEPNLDLLMIDAYLEHKLYDRSLACIDGLDKTVGGDPYLDVLRAGVHRVKGDRAAAKKCLSKAIAAEPDLPLAYRGLLSISLEEKKFSETSRLLTLLQKQFPDQMPAVASDPAYAEYVKSTAYRAWLRTQKR
jgi:tetratricopeptide (TPR) repeat protein